MKTPIFSIIVPVYNVEKYLSKCIDSVLAQTFSDFECILIDDGSTDESPSICDKYSLTDNRIKVIHKENGGLSDARNTGILNSTGEYIILLDSDDILSNNKALQNLADIIDRTNSQVIFNSIYTTFINNENRVNSSEQFFGNDDYYTPIAFYNLIISNNKAILAGWEFTVQRKYLLMNKLFFKHGILHEDELWIPFVICNADTIAINHNSFYSYRINRENSIMSEFNPKMLIYKQTIINDIQSNRSLIPKKLQFILDERCIMLWHTIFDTVFSLDEKYADEKKNILKKMKEQKKILFRGRNIKNYIYFFLVSFIGAKYIYHLREKSRMVKKITRYCFKFLSFTFNFNFFIAIKLVVVPYLTRNKPEYDRNAYKHKVIKGYLKGKLRKTIYSFKDKLHEVDFSLAENYQVFSLWWQGEEDMPPIVKTCYNTLKYYSNGHKINLITKDNFRDFVNLPDYILKKAKREILSITHLSDIIRMCLLYEHGGLWLDATVLLTGPLPILPPICSNLGFWTPKDDGNILEKCFGARNWIVRENRWLTFCFYLSKNNILAEFVRAMFFSYVKTNNIFVDYFLFDYFIAIAYDTFHDVRVMIDSVPENNPKVHEVYHRLNFNFEYNKALFDEICKDTFFHKLNWKEEAREYTTNNKLTNYGYIINNFPPK